MPPITGRGINQADLLYLLTLIRTNFVALTAALDADDGVTLTNYASALDFTVPTTISSPGIRDQGSVLDYLKTVRTKYMALLAKLDVDTLITDTNYAATNPMADIIDNLALGSLTQAGVYEGALTRWLSDYITDWNATLAKIDADLTDTTYATDYALSTTLVDATGCVTKP
jgi:hypothetical protein